jgi:hypothetical protein
MSVLLV